MTKPNFLCVGAQKSGTTTLYDVLKRHPQIYLPEKKELHFFDKEVNFKKEDKWYFDFFRNVKNEKAIGEITPNYMYIDVVPQRIYNYFGKEIKLIFILRNPVNRAFSHYLMKQHNGKTIKSFADEIRMDDILEKKEYLENNHILLRGIYDKQIQRYLQYFDRENMLFIILETELIKNKKATYKRIYEFLNVDYLDIKSEIRSNRATQLRNIKLNELITTDNVVKNILKFIVPIKSRNKAKDILSNMNKKNEINYGEFNKYSKLLNEKVYEKSILNLEKLINRDLSHWLIQGNQ